jgi:hypothetical protein
LDPFLPSLSMCFHVNEKNVSAVQTFPEGSDSDPFLLTDLGAAKPIENKGNHARPSLSQRGWSQSCTSLGAAKQMENQGKQFLSIPTAEGLDWEPFLLHQSGAARQMGNQ